MSERRKITISLSEDLYAEIVRRSEARGISLTELVRGALKLDFFVEDHDARLVIDDDGREREVLIR